MAGIEGNLSFYMNEEGTSLLAFLPGGAKPEDMLLLESGDHLTVASFFSTDFNSSGAYRFSGVIEIEDVDPYQIPSGSVPMVAENTYERVYCQKINLPIGGFEHANPREEHIKWIYYFAIGRQALLRT
jgi:hypothetical protein